MASPARSTTESASPQRSWSSALGDLGEGPKNGGPDDGGNLDTVRMIIRDAQDRVVVSADGRLDRGNLQAHEDLGPGQRDLPDPAGRLQRRLADPSSPTGDPQVLVVPAVP